MSAAELPEYTTTICDTRQADIGDISTAGGVCVSPVEASGLLYLPEEKRFLVISDETDGKEPMLFFMDTAGYIGQRTVVKRLSAINDMEGITRDTHGRVYLLASQSFNRKGKRTTARRLLVRMTGTGKSGFRADASVPLIDVLAKAAEQQPSAKWSSFVAGALREKSVDIEGIVWYNDTLLFGFKNPKMGNDAVILAASDPDALFRTGRVKPAQVMLWRRFPLFDTVSGTYCGVSDLCFTDGRLYGLSTGVSSSSGVEEDVGLFWTFDPATGSCTFFRHFSGLKPEGIAYNSDRGEFCIVFDNGSENPSQFMTVKVSP